MPDLRNRFIMCSSYSGDAGQTGGAASVTPTVSVQNATQGGSIVINGTGVRVLDHTLGIEQIPSHRHSIVAQDLNETPNPMGGILWASRGNQQTWYTDLNGGTQPHAHGIYDAGHTHTFTGAAHTHATTANTINTLPPYYKMAYCVKLPE